MDKNDGSELLRYKKPGTSRFTSKLLRKHLYRPAVVVLIFLSAWISGCAFNPTVSGTAGAAPEVDLFLISVEAQRAYQQSRWFDAVRLYQKIVEHVPADPVAWFRLANTFTRQGEYEQAVHAYEQSLLHNQEQPKAWYNLSTAYLLRAQSAMHQSHSLLSGDNLARELIRERLHRLDQLMMESAVNTSG